MPVDLLERTLQLPAKSKIITQPYVDFLTHQYQLSHNGAHGIEHWFRVLMNGRLIAAQTGADIEVIEHFASCMMLNATMKVTTLTTAVELQGAKLLSAIGCT